MNDDSTGAQPVGQAQEGMKERVLGAIKDGGVSMRPQWYFALSAGLAVAGIVIVSFSGLYLASFVVFAERRSGAWYVPAFGWSGWSALFLSLPWLLIALIALFIGLLEALVRRYAFAYRRPLLYSAVGIAVLVGAGGIAVGMTSIHQTLSRYAVGHNVPLVGTMYRNAGTHRRPDVHRGSVVSVADGGFVLDEQDGDVYAVVGAPGRMIDTAPLEAGDFVVVLGRAHSGVLSAVGVMEVADPDAD